MQIVSVQIVAADASMYSRMLSLLDSLEGVAVVSNSPDVICVGCDRLLPTSDVAAAHAVTGASKVPIALLTWDGCEGLAVQTLRNGIHEYLCAYQSPKEILAALCALHRVARETQLVCGEMLVGNSPATCDVRRYIEKLARTGSHVLVTGETGTGKEVVAQLIHHNSSRAHRRIVSVNCAAIPDTLLESELFGYERGAFTGAHASHEGKFKLADGGTIFLDEIGDMSPYAQSKILRVIESGEIQGLGSNKPQRVDLRVVAATNRDLDADTGQNQFRRDLFFRLNIGRIHLSPLRDRKEDLLPLADHFRRRFDRTFGRETKGFTVQSEQRILSHDWPGNVRELKNMIEAAFIDLDPGRQWVEMPSLFSRAVQRKNDLGAPEVERILQALSQTHWNRSKAAEALSWSRMTLYRKMERYGISATGMRQ